MQENDLNSLYMLCGPEVGEAEGLATSIYTRITLSGSNQDGVAERKKLAHTVSLIETKLEENAYTPQQIKEFSLLLCQTLWREAADADILSGEQKPCYLDELCAAFGVRPDKVLQGNDILTHAISQAEGYSRNMGVRALTDKVTVDTAERIIIKAVNSLALRIRKTTANDAKADPALIDESAKSLGLLWESMTISSLHSISDSGIKTYVKDVVVAHIDNSSWPDNIKSALSQAVTQGLGKQEKNDASEIDAKLWEEKKEWRNEKFTQESYPLVVAISESLRNAVEKNAEGAQHSDSIRAFKETLRNNLYEIRSILTRHSVPEDKSENILRGVCSMLDNHLKIHIDKHHISDNVSQLLSQAIADEIAPHQPSWSLRMQRKGPDRDIGI